MSWLTEPLSFDFFQRALIGGSLVAVLCGVVGTWVVIRGMAFLGEALAHGMLPGVALATILGVPVLIGAGLSAIAMSLGIGALQRRGGLSYDSSIGMLFVAMLAAGVIVISHARSFATDATAILFGDILAVSASDLVLLAWAAGAGVAVAAIAHRSLVALAVDARVAAVLGFSPRRAQVVLVGLVTLAVVASYQAVGSLLVVGLLIAPAIAASRWATRIPSTMLLASLIGVVVVVVGLLLSWHAGTAAGASIALVAVFVAVGSWMLRVAFDRTRLSLRVAALVALILPISACVGAAPDAAPDTAPSSAAAHGAVEGAQEVSEPQVGLALVDATGDVRHLDLVDESVADLGSVPAPRASTTDGRYVFTIADAGVSIIDSGRWTWDHGDHFHYYLAEPRMLGTVDGDGPATVATTMSSTSGGTGVFFAASGEAVLLDTHSLSEGEIVERFRLETRPHDGLIVPIGDFALVTEPRGGVAASLIVVDSAGERIPGAGADCSDARGTITTRVGAVVGCADGAVLATLVDGAVEIESIPYPEGTSTPRATAFAGREGRPTVAAVAGDDGVWLLDTRARAWTLVPTPTPVLTATAVDDAAEHLLALTRDGRMLVIDGGGVIVSHTEPLLAESLARGGNAPVLFADQNRVYLSDPAERRIYEIDFADSARIARTFETPDEPAFIAGTGR